jgi:hypothetical protein
MSAAELPTAVEPRQSWTNFGQVNASSTGMRDVFAEPAQRTDIAFDVDSGEDQAVPFSSTSRTDAGVRPATATFWAPAARHRCTAISTSKHI